MTCAENKKHVSLPINTAATFTLAFSPYSQYKLHSAANKMYVENL